MDVELNRLNKCFGEHKILLGLNLRLEDHGIYGLWARPARAKPRCFVF